MNIDTCDLDERVDHRDNVAAGVNVVARRAIAGVAQRTNVNATLDQQRNDTRADGGGTAQIVGVVKRGASANERQRGALVAEQHRKVQCGDVVLIVHAETGAARNQQLSDLVAADRIGPHGAMQRRLRVSSAQLVDVRAGIN
jgi:hypothetical protein